MARPSRADPRHAIAHSCVCKHPLSPTEPTVPTEHTLCASDGCRRPDNNIWTTGNSAAAARDNDRRSVADLRRSDPRDTVFSAFGHENSLSFGTLSACSGPWCWVGERRRQQLCTRRCTIACMPSARRVRRGLGDGGCAEGHGSGWPEGDGSREAYDVWETNAAASAAYK